MIFEKDIIDNNINSYDNNNTKLQSSRIILRDDEEYIKSNMEKFRKLEEDLNEMFVNKVKSDDYENVPKHIKRILDYDIENNRIIIFKDNFTYVPYYNYSEYIKEKCIHINKPKKITDFIHAVVKIVGKEPLSFYSAIYRELEKWNNDDYRVVVELMENEAYVNIIYFKPLMAPRGE